jgi:trigger factor
MTSLKQRPDGTLEITINIAWSKIAQVFDSVTIEAVKKAEISGFRKGKAPRSLVEKNLDRSKISEEVIKRIIPEMYEEAIKEHKLNPIILPKIVLKDVKEEKDWVIIALTSNKPKITISDYKTKIRDLKKAKNAKIWLPGEAPQEKNNPKSVKPSLDEILKALNECIQAVVSPLLLEHEVNRMLSDLIDQTRKLGMTVEQYLTAKGLTADNLRAEYEAQARRALVLEFALEEIADQEKITVSETDINTIIKTAKTDEEKQKLEHERYYIASALRRQKTLDFVASL